MTNCSIRVLIIEDDPQTCQDLEELCELQQWQSHVVSQPRNEIVMLAEARTFRPQVAIVDMRLVEGDISNREGFDHIPRLSPAQCVVYSAHLEPKDVRDAWKDAGAFDVVSKAERIEGLVGAIKNAASSACICTLGDFVVAWPEGRTSENMFQPLCDDENAPTDQMLDIIGRLFQRENHNTTEQRIVTDWMDTSDAASSAGVHQNAAILKAWRPGEAPLLVKFGDPKRIKQEAEKFAEIKNILPGTRYADAEKHVIWWDIGAIAYRLLGTHPDETKTFAKFYQDTVWEDFEQIEAVLEDIFGQVLMPFYKQQRLSLYADLFNAYDEALNKEKKKLTRLLETPTKRPTLPAEFDTLLDPIAWLKLNRYCCRIPSLYDAYTHGDLHSSNILVNDLNQVWLIDFERAGFGPRLRDYVELEVDLLTRLVPFHGEKALQDFYRLACCATESQPGDCDFSGWDEKEQKALKTVQQLHKLAESVDPREWWWGLLLDSLFVLQVFEDHNDERYKRAWVLASVCASRLEENK